MPSCSTLPRVHIVSAFLVGGHQVGIQQPGLWLSRCSWVFGQGVQYCFQANLLPESKLARFVTLGTMHKHPNPNLRTPNTVDSTFMGWSSGGAHSILRGCKSSAPLAFIR